MSRQPPADASDDEDQRRFPIPPGAVVLVLGLLFGGAVVVGIALNNCGGGSEVRTVSVADLRADPDRWDEQSVVLTGRVENARVLPYLTQYAIYTFRDDTGSILVLSQKGAPPGAADNTILLTAIYHARVTLDDELRAIVEEQFGPLAGVAVDLLLPGIPLNVVFLEHQRYSVQEAD